MTKRLVSLFVLAVALLWGSSSGAPLAAAHTETDVVPVLSGSSQSFTRLAGVLPVFHEYHNPPK